MAENSNMSNTQLSTLWDEEEVRLAFTRKQSGDVLLDSAIVTYNVTRFVPPLHHISRWRNGLSAGTLRDANKEGLGPDLWDDLLACAIPMKPNQFIIAAPTGRATEPMATALLLSEFVKIELTENSASDKALLALHEYAFCADWKAVRASLKLLHSLCDYDKIRGNYRFNFGFAQTIVPKARKFDGVPADDENVAYPRMSRVHLDGGIHCDIVVDHVVRLLGLLRKVMSTDIFQDSPVLQTLSPLGFPFHVDGFDTRNRANMSPYKEALEVMNRFSICLFEGTCASAESDEFARDRYKQKVTGYANTKFTDNFVSTHLHVDPSDLPVLQLVVVVSFHMSEECFCIIDARGNQAILFHDHGLVQGVKVYVYSGYFTSHYHGKVEVSSDYIRNCAPDAWMIRIAPYSTKHCAAWNEKLMAMGKRERIPTVSSIYMMPGSDRLGRDSYVGENKKRKHS